MAALAALGGVSSTAVSWIGASLRALTGLPGGLQFLAGIHVLWLVLAVGLVGKPGAGTVTGLLKGAVELFSGNSHGLLVFLLSGFGGVVVDLVWLVVRRRDRLLIYMLAGGLGAASNLLVFKFVFSLPSYRWVNLGLLLLAVVAFVSGVFLAGLLGWSLIQGLRRAGVVGTQRPITNGCSNVHTWLRLGLVGLALAAIGTAMHFSRTHGTTGSEEPNRNSQNPTQAQPVDP